MKKNYKAPSISSHEIRLTNMIAESIGIDPSNFYDPTEGLAKDPVEDLFGNEDFNIGKDFGNESWGGADEW